HPNNDNPISYIFVRQSRRAAMISRNKRKITTTQRTAAHSVTAGGCGQTPPRRSTAPPGRKPHLDSDQNPDLALPDLRRKPVHPLPPHRRAPAVDQAEPPAVQGADNFSLLDPALAQRATGMRAAIRQGDNRLSGPEDRQAQTKDFAGSTPPRGNLVVAAHQDPIGHDTWHSRRQPGWKTASLGLASEASTTGRFYGNDRLSPNVLSWSSTPPS